MSLKEGSRSEKKRNDKISLRVAEQINLLNSQLPNCSGHLCVSIGKSSRFIGHPALIRRQRKRTYEDEEFEDPDQSIRRSGQYILHGRDDSPVPFNRRTKRSRVSKRELESDFSDESDCDSDCDVSRKHMSRANKSLCRERKVPKRKEARAKSRGRSVPRAPSPQLLQRTMQARQHPTEEIENDRQQCDEDHGSMECNVAHQEAHKDVERVREPNDSNSGSTLENSRD